MKETDTARERLFVRLSEAQRRISELELLERIHLRGQEELRRSEERFRSLVNSTDDSIYVVDRDCNYLFMNRKHLDRLGLASEDKLNAKSYRDFHSAVEAADFQEHVDTVFRTGQSVQHEYRAERDKKFFIRTLSPVRDALDNVTAVTTISKDITERKRMEEELRALSLTDELTGLHNRRGFFTLVNQELRTANRLGKEALLFAVDMDDLKIINDTCGHQTDDQAIRDAADMIRRNFRESDIIARIGGDEFAVFLIEYAAIDADVLARRLQELTAIYNSQGARCYKLSLSMGWARYDPANAVPLDDLMNLADRGMYSQKREHSRGRK